MEKLSYLRKMFQCKKTKKKHNIPDLFLKNHKKLTVSIKREGKKCASKIKKRALKQFQMVEQLV